MPPFKLNLTWRRRYGVADFAVDDAEAALEKCVVAAQKSGEELACAGYVIYSSSTVMMLSVGDGVYGGAVFSHHIQALIRLFYRSPPVRNAYLPYLPYLPQSKP